MSHINNLSNILGRVLLGKTITRLGLMCLAQGHNAVAPARLEPTDTRSRVKHSTTIVNLNFSILKIRSGVCLCTVKPQKIRTPIF